MREFTLFHFLLQLILSFLSFLIILFHSLQSFTWVNSKIPCSHLDLSWLFTLSLSSSSTCTSCISCWAIFPWILLLLHLFILTCLLRYLPNYLFHCWVQMRSWVKSRVALQCFITNFVAILSQHGFQSFFLIILLIILLNKLIDPADRRFKLALLRTDTVDIKILRVFWSMSSFHY